MVTLLTAYMARLARLRWRVSGKRVIPVAQMFAEASTSDRVASQLLGIESHPEASTQSKSHDDLPWRGESRRER